MTALLTRYAAAKAREAELLLLAANGIDARAALADVALYLRRLDAVIEATS